MKNDGVMSLVDVGQGKDTLTEVPKAPNFLNTTAKKHFKDFAEKLIKLERLKESHEAALAIAADAYAQFEWACREINDLNKKEHGRGYIQRFASGARNLSPEVTLRDAAIKTLMQCFKQFGLDPKSEKDLKAVVPDGQLDMFAAFDQKNHG